MQIQHGICIAIIVDFHKNMYNTYTQRTTKATRVKHQTIHRIGIIGSGIAGLSAAWLLRNRYELDLYEQNDYTGGHTHTIEVEEEGSKIPIDTGFIVYNEPNYPQLTQLLRHLDVQTQPTDMSFAVSVGQGKLEYAGDNLSKLFAQRRNLFNRRFLSMIKEILRFNKQCKQILEHDDPSLSLGEFLDLNGYNRQFREHYLLPMASAIWSCPTRTMLSFPVSSFVRFFHNHGLINLKQRPQWKTVVNGSWQYVKKMSAGLVNKVRLKEPVISVRRLADGVEVVTAQGRKQRYDALILACHADQALSLLENPSRLEKQLLSQFHYQKNQAFLHTDPSLMPKSRSVWSSWNYLSDDRQTGDNAVSVSYWMNRLQRLEAGRDYIVSLNPLREPRRNRLIAEMTYDHPVFDSAAMLAQQRLEQIQGSERIWYCGSYFGYGFHEDALRSSIELAAKLDVPAPWETRAYRPRQQHAINHLADLARSAGV